MRNHMTDGRVILRKYRMGDESAHYEGICESVDELRKWGGVFFFEGFTLEDAGEEVISCIHSWKEGKSYSFVIEELPDQAFAGNCRIEELEPERNHAGLGWWVRTSRTRRGVATAAGRLVARAAFEDLGLSSLGVYANADNTASRRVAEKLGAVLVRIKPEEDGSYCAVYERKPEDLDAG